MAPAGSVIPAKAVILGEGIRRGAVPQPSPRPRAGAHRVKRTDRGTSL